MSRSDLLLASWNALATRLGLREAEAVGQDLVARYAEPRRRYHTLDHLAHVLEVLGRMGTDDRLAAAAWFHDAVYDPGASDNEDASARLASQALTRHGMAPADAAFVRDAVLATASHASERPEFGALLDADLSILGGTPEEYARYRDGIRAEYANVPGVLFRAGRRRLLRGMLKREHLFATEYGRAHYEANARRNLKAELDGL